MKNLWGCAFLVVLENGERRGVEDSGDARPGDPKMSETLRI